MFSNSMVEPSSFCTFPSPYICVNQLFAEENASARALLLCGFAISRIAFQRIDHAGAYDSVCGCAFSRLLCARSDRSVSERAACARGAKAPGVHSVRRAGGRGEEAAEISQHT